MRNESLRGLRAMTPWRSKIKRSSVTRLARQDLGPSEYSCLNLLARSSSSSSSSTRPAARFCRSEEIRAPRVDAREMREETFWQKWIPSPSGSRFYNFLDSRMFPGEIFHIDGSTLELLNSRQNDFQIFVSVIRWYSMNVDIYRANSVKLCPY